MLFLRRLATIEALLRDSGTQQRVTAIIALLFLLNTCDGVVCRVHLFRRCLSGDLWYFIVYFIVFICILQNMLRYDPSDVIPNKCFLLTYNWQFDEHEWICQICWLVHLCSDEVLNAASLLIPTQLRSSLGMCSHFSDSGLIYFGLGGKCNL